MDHAAYHVVYVDNRANNDLDGKYIHKSRPRPQDVAKAGRQDSWDDRNSEYLEQILCQIEEVRNNIKSILSIYNGGTLKPHMDISWLFPPPPTFIANQTLMPLCEGP